MTVFLFGGGLALYQMTALVLGAPTTTRQLDISLNLPSITTDEFAQPFEDSLHLVVGTLAPAPVAAVRATPTVHRSTKPARVVAPARVAHQAPVVSAPSITIPTVTTPVPPTPVVPPGVLPTPVSPWPVDEDGHPSSDADRPSPRD